MAYIPASLRQTVIQRAGNRCEYCQLSQEGQVATFHIDHIVPVRADGETREDNLALACVSCSLRKAARQTAQDPESGEQVPIFNPRRQNWTDHFRWDDIRVVGLTAIGRAAVAALDMNRPIVLAIRAEEVYFDRHPPA
jgi:hypothetical protein